MSENNQDHVEFVGDYSVDDEDQLQPEDTLAQGGADDALDEGVVPTDGYSPAQGFGNTPEEAHEGETLDQRIEQEVPEADPLGEPGTGPREPGEQLGGDDQLGEVPTGQLASDDVEVAGTGREDDRLADELGADSEGALAAAEEDAVRVIPEPGEGSL